MCWIGENIERIAKEDIPCFKIVRKTEAKDVVESVYMHKCYQLNKLYELEDVIIPELGYNYNGRPCGIYRGFHSYNSDVTVRITNDDVTPIYFVVYSGDIAPRMLDSFFIAIDNLCKVEGIIPKGSTYYLNRQGEYVSNKIKLLRIEQRYI